MHLFVDGHVLEAEFQGTSTYILQMYKSLAKLRPSYTFYVGIGDPEVIKNLFSGFENVIGVRYYFSSTVGRLLFDFPRLWFRYKFSCAHFQYVCPPFRIPGCIYLTTIHDLLFIDHPQYFGFFYKWIRFFTFGYSARISDLVATVSSYSLKSIKNTYGLTDEKIFVTPNGVDIAYFNGINRNDSESFIKEKYRLENFILYVSRVEPRKNHIALVKAFIEAGLQHSGYKLLLIGSRTLPYPEFDRYINTLNAKNSSSVIFLDAIPNSDLMHFYRSCAVFVYPSFCEGFGIPPIEAAASESRVLCSNVTAMMDFHFFGDNFFDPNDHVELRLKLLSLLSKDSCPNECISSTIKSNYSWDRTATIFLNHIECFLDKKNAKDPDSTP